MQNSIVTKFVAFLIALYLEKQIEHFCCGSRASPDFSMPIMISWDSFKVICFVIQIIPIIPMNHITGKDFALGRWSHKVLSRGFFSPRLHPASVEVVNT